VRDPVQEIARSKEADGIAQVVELLPSKCKALGSNLGTVHTQSLFLSSINIDILSFVFINIFLM
jgi:hypothetical protein